MRTMIASDLVTDAILDPAEYSRNDGIWLALWTMEPPRHVTAPQVDPREVRQERRRNPERRDATPWVPNVRWTGW